MPNKQLSALTTVALTDTGDHFYVVSGGNSRQANGIGATSVIYTQSGTGATARNIQAKLRESVSVADFGAVGDNTTDDTAAIQAAIDACFGTAAAPNASTNAYLNKPLYFPPGKYNITSALLLTKVRGAHIFGAGRFTTTITNSAGGNVFTTNGFEYSRVEGLQLVGSGTAQLFRLTWDGTSGSTLQSNTFADMYFQSGEIGVNIGPDGNMGSENLFLNCFWAGQTTAGIRTSNFNALQNTVVGCNFQDCAIGILVQSGSVTLVASVGFQGSTDFDIKVNNSANDTINIIGCRSESVNFYWSNQSVDSRVVGCSHIHATTEGYFINGGNNPTSVEGCVSVWGFIDVGGTTKLSVKNSSFGRLDWLAMNSGSPLTTGSVILEHIQYGDTYAGDGDGAGARIHKQFIDNSGVHTYRPRERSIEDFGAVGDDSTDNTTTIQAALDDGHTEIYVPEGIFQTQTLTIPSGVKFFGGPGTIKAATGATGWLTQILTHPGPLLIHDLTFDVDSTTFATVICTTINASTDVTLKNLKYINSGQEAVWFRGANTNCGIEDSMILNFATRAIESDATVSANTGTFVLRNRIISPGNNLGIPCDLNSEILLRFNDNYIDGASNVEAAAPFGVHIPSVNGATVKRNYIKNTDKETLVVTGTKAVITDNVLEDLVGISDDFGMNSGASNSLVARNVVRFAGKSGIALVDGFDDGVCEDNVIIDCGQSSPGTGILVGSTVSGNRVHGNTITSSDGNMTTGIGEFGSADSNIYTNNYISGWTAQQYSIAGASSVVVHPPITKASAVAVPHTGDTVETQLARIPVIGGSMGANGFIVVTTFWTVNNDASVKTARVRFGGTSGVTGTLYDSKALANLLSATSQKLVYNRNAANSQVGADSASNFGATSTSAGVTSALDTTAQQDIVITGQLADGTDTITLEAYRVEVHYRP